MKNRINTALDTPVDKTVADVVEAVCGAYVKTCVERPKAIAKLFGMIFPPPGNRKLKNLIATCQVDVKRAEKAEALIMDLASTEVYLETENADGTVERRKAVAADAGAVVQCSTHAGMSVMMTGLVERRISEAEAKKRISTTPTVPVQPYIAQTSDQMMRKAEDAEKARAEAEETRLRNIEASKARAAVREVVGAGNDATVTHPHVVHAGCRAAKGCGTSPTSSANASASSGAASGAESGRTPRSRSEASRHHAGPSVDLRRCGFGPPCRQNE